MMKNILMLALLLWAVTSCGDDKPAEGEQITMEEGDNFTITGTIEGAANTTFYLEAQSEQGVISVAESTADENGVFTMAGNVPGLGLYQLRMGDAPNQVLLLTLVPNDQLSIEATAATYNKIPEAQGTQWAKNMTEYMRVVDEFRTKQNEIIALQNKVSNEELQEKYMAIKQVVEDFAVKKMKADPSNPFNIVLSTYAVPAMDFGDWNPENLEVLRTVSEAYGKKYPDSPITAMFANQVYQIEQAYNEYVANNSGTKEAPEIALNNPDGKEIKLSSLRGKYVLIDFWASWCGPCRRENPNVVRIYNRFKDKGFTIYSVSLDNNLENWKEAIKKDGLVWPNHVSDLLQWKSPLPQLYGFSGIPYTVLLNKEGKIIGTGLRGKALEQKLEDIFKN